MARMKGLVAWWQSLRIPWRPWRIVGQVCAADEVPDLLPPQGVVLVGAPRNATWAAFDCPCRAGHRLLVNLDRARAPFWQIDSRRPLSIRPSIDYITPERRCHFTILRGKIKWAIYEQEVNQ